MARGKGEGSVYKRTSDGLWCARIELPKGPFGERRTKGVSRKNKKDVLAEMAKLKRELDRLGDLPTSSLTLGKWLRRWIDDIAPAEIRPKSYASYKSTVDLWLIPLLGRHKIDSLSADHVRDMFKHIQATPKSLKLRDKKPDEWPKGTVMVGADTAIKAHAVLSSALKTAMREGKATRNVCEMVDPPRKLKTAQGALTVDQAIHLLQYVLGTEHGAMWACYLLTGARRGEVLGLETDRVTDSVDLSWQLIRITDISKAPADYEVRHLAGTQYLARPKSRSGWRVLPLVEPLRSILALHMQGRPPGLVFTFNGRPWDPDTATKEWAKLLKDAGLPSNVVLHGARHGAVDLLYKAGVPEDLIQSIVGHSTRSMTRAYKTGVDTDRAREGMQALSALLYPQIEA